MTRKIKQWNILTITLLLVLACACTARAGIGDCTDIQTDKGAVMGKLDKTGVCAYKGIPYAAPPVGDLRFTPPQPPAAWTDTLKAGKFGNECLQFPMGLGPAQSVTGSEDCLSLNVWQPASAEAEKLPVMVYIHGGGFVTGSGSTDWYHGRNLAKKGNVIVVTFNYRLGPFGFLAHPALKDADGNMGNYGMMDQIQALEWVQKNIGNFGGDAGNVTIFGQSAGALSVSLLTLCPRAKGLFHKAIIMSGSASVLSKTDDDETANGMVAAEKVGCGDVALADVCLRATDAEFMMTEIKPSLGLMSDAELKEGFPFHPVIDGELFPDIPAAMLNNGQFDTSIPIMIGSTKEEATIFLFGKKIESEQAFKDTFKSDAAMIRNSFGIEADSDELLNYYPVSAYDSPRTAYVDLFTDLAFTCPSRNHAAMLADNGATAYLYHFQRAPSAMGLFKDLGAFHGSEIPFVFDNWKIMGMSLKSKENSALSDQMIALWSSFARDGKPAAPGMPDWPAFNSAEAPYLHIDLTSEVRNNYKGEECAFQGDLIMSSFLK